MEKSPGPAKRANDSGTKQIIPRVRKASVKRKLILVKRSKTRKTGLRKWDRRAKRRKYFDFVWAGDP